VLARAKREGILPAVRPSIEALQRTGFFVSNALAKRVLREAGETT
jgi:predicted nucleic acid-binding protein